ncbi:MAG TPA: LytR C-terminal domain-containing protein [Solirubrobacteraceae bacterium]|nr:LytR C-terminal domain-containing protein [Solirubrobacteraceae bacterium]
MVVLAFSLQDQVEKYGAYVGLAAFLGLAVLTLLYFAQARELKRLRDWAGRAPERAQELEARVVAQAEEARRVPEPAAERSGAVGPAQPVTAGNGRPAEAPVAVPMGPRPAVAMARAAATVAAAPAAPERSEGAEVAEEQVAAPVPDGAGPPPTDGEGPGEDTAEHAAVAATNGDEPAEPQADAPEPEAAEPEAEAEPEPAKDTDDAPALPGNGVPAPVTIPRATPRPQPRPAAPLRATPSRSATLPPRRPGPPPRRPAKEPSRAGRWTLFTLLAIGVAVAAVAVPVFLLGGDEPAPAPNTTAESTPDAATGGGGGGGTEAVAARPETVVTVLNGTPTEGLASQTRDKLIADGYSDEQGMIRTGNNTDQQRQDSVIFFADGERRQARDVGSILGIRALEAIDPETQALADATDATNSGQPSKVVVLLGSDQSP